MNAEQAKELHLRDEAERQELAKLRKLFDEQMNWKRRYESEALLHAAAEDTIDELRTQLEQMDDERLSWKREAESRGEENKRLKRDVAKYEKWIVSHPPEQGDHACSLCYPQSHCLINGFVCAYHAAMTEGGKARQ